MRWMGLFALALAAALPAAAAERPNVGITFLNSGGLFGVSPSDSSVSLVQGNACPGTSSLPCPFVRQASWSPDGMRLAFTFGSELHVYDSREGSQRLLPTGVDVGGDSRPAWSPDGRELAFASVNIGDDVSSEPSPSGGYSSGSSTSFSDLYAINVDNGVVRPLTTGKQALDPAWAPGSQIVYSSLVQGRWELFTIDPGGGNRQLTDGGAGVNRRASWSPDGTEIAFLSDRGGIQPRLNAIRPDGSGLRQLSNLPIDPVLGDQPAWSPDGSMIAVSTSLNGRRDVITGNRPGRDLYVVAADGSGEKRLTQSGERGVADRGPTWSPDGSMLAFESYDRDKLSESALYMVNADGRCETRASAVGGWRPEWQPLPGLAIAPRECADLSVVTTDPTKLGPFARVRVRLVNDGTKPLGEIRLQSERSDATVLTASSREAGCSVARGRLNCRLGLLRVGATVDVDVLLEARVLTRFAGVVLGPDIGFSATTRNAEAGRGNNSLLTKIPLTSCTTGSPGSGSIQGTEGDNTICGRKGHDRINGLGGNDLISGGDGNDVLRGGPGNDVITPGPGKDVVSCGPGRDLVIADAADRVARDCERVRRS